ncbi:MAG: putative lipid II flippase FtsW [Acidobacteria bacterium]|nr:putative lipid II flippase FtsW [Acidobacteriota bacterium]
MPKRFAPDPILLLTIALLFVFGLMMVYSASGVYADKTFGNSYFLLMKQLAAGFIGVVAMLFLSNLNYRILREKAVIYLLIGITFILLIAVLFAPAVNGAHRWLRFGAFSFQPSELAKLVLVIFLARRLANKEKGELPKRGDIPLLLFVLGGFSFLVIIERDLGSSMFILTLGLVLLFIGGMSFGYLVLFAAGTTFFFWYAVFIRHHGIMRVLAYLDPWSYSRQGGWQIIQSLTAIGSGGIFGVGFGQGEQKLFFLPKPYTDFIFSVISEELGFIGASAVIAAFIIILIRGLKVSFNAPDPFGRYLALGITLMIVIQALINISVALNILPTKGIPLPLISYGGSSLLITLCALGILLNISRYSSFRVG